ncbi:ABC transporter ATP-binding protein [Psychrosphaera aquimarina]|uniref:ABC transporter ATP-binding protein n=1 Tax=Psychrosphaera aquimarina TaxID=2044854 RepID=A0ABU3R1D5_9GAMM|nr:ABC transporter ATP-binding protein [Psychrosphaera aquimarina]MDU0113464.1 ABC transporter ATP-binding protein [Psychrosphaera aquimarina]
MFSFFERLTTPFPKNDNLKPPTGIFAFLMHYSKGMLLAVFAVAIMSALIAVLEVSLFGFLGQLVDWLSTQERTTFIANNESTLIWMGLLVLIGLPFIVILQSLVTHQTLMGNYPMKIRWQAHSYLLAQSLSFFQNEFAGRVATKVMQTSLAVRETVMKVVDILVYIGVYFISIGVLVFNIDWRLATPLFVWFIVYVLILRTLLPRLKKVSQKQADARSLMTGRIVDSYTNISTVKLFSHTNQEAEYAKDSMDGFLQTVYPQMRLATWLYSAVWINNAILIFTMASMSIYLWLQQVVTPGDIAIAISLCLRINSMSQWVMWEVSALFENIGTVQDGINTLAKPIEVQDINNANDLNIQQGAIDFRNITFNYDEKNRVFDQLDIKIKPGEKVGIVGRSGAGKSTLVNLLLRFYNLDKGGIYIDGQNIAEVSQRSLRANISMVTQDTSLLHRTIKENIAYGKQNAQTDEIIEAAKAAEADEFIAKLSDNKGNTAYDVQVGERGVKLSGGQRQRIAIARVILKNAPILILDEATSALDSEVEQAIQKSLDNLMENKTVLAIAHRLSTIAQMDRLLVLDQGKIVESGSHAELLELNGIYAKLWQHQTGGFLGLE